MTPVGRAAIVATALVATLAASVAGEPQTAPRTASIYVQSPLPWWQTFRKPPDFQLSIDGMPVEIVHVSRGPQPLSAVVLFDVSGSMSEWNERWEPFSLLDLDKAAKRLASVARPDDRLRLGTVASKIAIATTLLADPKSASKAAREIQQRGGPSPLWDAIDRSLDAIAGQPGVHAILLHSDGQAAGNDISADEILARAQKAGASISAVGLSDRGLPQIRQRSLIEIVGRNDRLQRLVRETGGLYFELKEPDELPVEYFVAALTSLRQRYRLDFVPPRRDGRLHEVAVTVGEKAAKTAKYIAY